MALDFGDGWQGFSKFLVGFKNNPNGVLQVLQGFGVGFTFYVASLQDRTLGVVSALFHTFQDDGIQMCFHNLLLHS
ncbi:MAG: hypothetical protein A3F84_01180 [Candidatus Handelsmanbacteria bacterium RIFCSPLOWO2_12_FULL_64_10]|uniref:Uncharacterized protein n=1 Tax=Handelsmanbacteria sp. (strain RIFCSPLOWO2_12_FULL_64_10) TaxID=1817868 RepID=A0A1F6C9Y8_HANXR|nr:MAG: hypothetical protein A3F84_01180 [Candidatus Handelsmanbacteria bacterium RIFCSPLOWO2_12_FULL_64_10]